jgi:uncharacterized protein YijF (DUF1287 family)
MRRGARLGKRQRSSCAFVHNDAMRNVLVALTLLAVLSVRADPPADRERFLRGAEAQVGRTLSYDSAYRQLRYPGGDVPLETGVCSDVVVRAFRGAGVDLQVLVHRDMQAHFSDYPRTWGLRRPDPNIDHRRVPNLATFFRRQGKELEPSRRAADYAPGDIVIWRLPSGVPHIGIVSDQKEPRSDRYKVVHNIGAGAQIEDTLFAFAITGHYRWFP